LSLITFFLSNPKMLWEAHPVFCSFVPGFATANSLLFD
jgi:hypothetical protein